MSLWRKIQRRFQPNPLDVMLTDALQKDVKQVLIVWNRGLGDIPLGIYGLVHRIREVLPKPGITFLTRPDLAKGFSLIEGVSVIPCESMKRGALYDLDQKLASVGKKRDEFGWVLDNPNLSYWLESQIGKLTPRMKWNPDWDLLPARFRLEKGKKYVGVHVQTETVYNYEKNWPEASWKKLFQHLVDEHGMEVILFGFEKMPDFSREGVIDLRGNTDLFEMLSIIKNCCGYLVVPDSGILSFSYYIDAPFDIRVVSIWADPRQGVLRQKVLSPNPGYEHIPLVGKHKKVKRIPVESVVEAMLNPKRKKEWKIVRY